MKVDWNVRRQAVIIRIEHCFINKRQYLMYFMISCGSAPCFRSHIALAQQHLQGFQFQSIVTIKRDIPPESNQSSAETWRLTFEFLAVRSQRTQKRKSTFRKRRLLNGRRTDVTRQPRRFVKQMRVR